LGLVYVYIQDGYLFKKTENIWHMEDYKVIQFRLKEIQISYEEERSKDQRHVGACEEI